MRMLLAAIALTTPSYVAASQPYSESMADCAALFQNAAQWVQSEDKAEQLMHTARAWHAAAVAQANAEGRPLPNADMWAKIDKKTENWAAKGTLFVFSQEFRDWASYCRSFAQHTGIETGL